MQKKRNNIKIFTIFLLLTVNVSGQTLIPFDTLTIDSWSNIFNKQFGLIVRESLELSYKNKKLVLPTRWSYDNSKNCSECNFLYYPINKTSFFLVMYNGGQLGSYIFYFDSKRKNKSWIQQNFITDSINLNKVNSDLYYFELLSYDESTEQILRRYVFVNSSGVIAKDVLDIDSTNLLVETIDNNKKVVTLNIGTDNGKLQFDYRNMKIINELLNPKNLRIQKTVFSNLKKIG